MKFSYKEIYRTQKFLKSPDLVKKLISKTDISIGDTVLDIGAGKGIITKALCEAVGDTGRVYAVEIDPVLTDEVKSSLNQYKSLRVFNENIFNFNWNLLGDIYYIFANIPFNQTSQIINKILSQYPKVLGSWLVVETAAAKMYCGRSCEAKQECYKSIDAQYRHDLMIKHRFNISDFKPSPSYAPVLLEIKPKLNPKISSGNYQLFSKFLIRISKDRVGEGQWKNIFTTRQLKVLYKNGVLVANRGLSSQSFQGILEAFNVYNKNFAFKMN